MNRYKYTGNQKKERKPFSECERCHRVWKEDFKCCTEKPVVSKPSDAFRASFKTPGSHAEIWNNAAREMDGPEETPNNDWDTDE